MTTETEIRQFTLDSVEKFTDFYTGEIDVDRLSLFVAERFDELEADPCQSQDTYLEVIASDMVFNIVSDVVERVTVG